MIPFNSEGPLFFCLQSGNLPTKSRPKSLSELVITFDIPFLLLLPQASLSNQTWPETPTAKSGCISFALSGQDVLSGLALPAYADPETIGYKINGGFQSDATLSEQKHTCQAVIALMHKYAIRRMVMRTVEFICTSFQVPFHVWIRDKLAGRVL